ncbi:hypothetical protein CU097_004204 [Rhizopus azygosporus]|uniref:Uncharacterized protein n=1 Tax=Rhizopus azygosporus TaxID=86630 RepID=A0A367JBU0_RHIAZ|nr:hypothetical protein CU097_004204 [Rhizopus azygosporus]
MNVNVFAESMEMGEEHSAVLLESRSENSPLEVKFEAADIPDETLNQSLDLYLLAGKNGVSRNAFDGMIKMVNTRKVYKSFLMFAGGDLPATIKMAGLSGHSHTCSCKICVARRRTQTVFWCGPSTSFYNASSTLQIPLKLSNKSTKDINALLLNRTF